MAHTHDLKPWQHAHVFDTGNRLGERRTHWVLAITLLTMVVEIAAGWWTGSMALLADGWHMGTHALALAVTAGAYWLARRHAQDTRYTFGTWKIEVLGSFASALVLGLVGVGIVVESVVRLWRAEPLEAQSALVVAVIGLVVNLVSAWLLHGAQGGHGHGHDHDHGHGHHDHHGHHHHGHPHHDHGHARAGEDLNLRAAYAHVLADALTSVFAIVALSAALWLGWTWLDPVVGIVGAVVIGVWAWGLMRQSAAVLLDREMHLPITQEVRDAIESDGDAKVADLHVWRVGRDKFAAIVCVVADVPLAPSVYRERLAVHEELAHVSIEVNRCPHMG
ncbi:CDF family Co(II)/Ni(II) efflux transporter DmeF [Piscinibacter sp. HJYY11]|uniref:CDF family Co(II)/Ni(II) efflux transporter DmeF n=1 Tax=Piscinibacter sp. HJYY11 TaxID=2801333 RepID=UPI00191D5D3F|nr:CDF family Co(II)/Ni(II) efflux transporter DmeF [Piscinibacter sp. HJYY11]MBL0728661.1 CDF family Co(II)/Ni(II) efflux transporter DmeF [Piscinibacter sp. HJYY11]